MKTDFYIHNITPQQIQIQIQDELFRVLEKIPVLRNVDVYSSKNEMYDIQAKAEIDFVQSLNILCAVKVKGEPQYIRRAISQLLEAKRKMEDSNDNEYYCIIAAPYISQNSSIICEEMGVGYIDLSGNCLLKYKSIYIRVEGNENKYKETRSSKSIFERSSVKSSIILRHLFKNIEKGWKIQELAEASLTSVGQVSKVKKFLEEREYIASKDTGFSIGRPKELLIEWGKVYNSKANTSNEYYSLDTIPQIENKLIQLKERSGIEYALTGFSGGVRYSPTVRYNKVHIYISLQDLKEATKILELKRVASGSNISIIVPYDPCVLIDTRNIKDNIVASPVQVCLDLMGLKGRGEEEMAAILEKEFN